MKGLHDKNRVTLILVTHDAGLASEAERRIVLQDGSVVSDESGGSRESGESRASGEPTVLREWIE
jgi:ABC-type lipoprotein export system ATPase subunit